MNYKVFTFVLLAFFISKKGYSQEKSREVSPTQLTLPDSYYKGQEEKRKYAEKTGKGTSVVTMTATTSYPQSMVVKEVEDSPDTKARKLLNTSVVPADFPVYKNTMSKKEYETTVAAWFKANPSYRKVNK